MSGSKKSLAEWTRCFLLRDAPHSANRRGRTEHGLQIGASLSGQGSGHDREYSAINRIFSKGLDNAHIPSYHPIMRPMGAHYFFSRCMEVWSSRFTLPEASAVSLIVYDVMGREVERLLDKTLGAGYHEARWDATGLPSGIYLYRIEAGAFAQTRRMTLLK